MRLKTVRLVVMLALVLLTAPLTAYAQPATKVYRIGYVRVGTASSTESQGEAFTQRLRELGYTEIIVPSVNEWKNRKIVVNGAYDLLSKLKNSEEEGGHSH